jgi:hypothetical protein
MSTILPDLSTACDDVKVAAEAVDIAAKDVRELADRLRRFAEVLGGDDPHPAELAYASEEISRVIAELHEAQGALLFS